MTREERNRFHAIIAALAVACAIMFTGATVYCVRCAQARQTSETLMLHVSALEDDKDILGERIMAAEAMLSAANRRIAELEGLVDELSKPLPEPEPDSYEELGWDFDYVVRVVGAEARGEPVEGILAVCECIANTAEATGMTPEQVVKVPGQYTSPVGRNVKDGMQTVNECCLRVFVQGERPHSEPIRYFYAYKNGYSAWHEGKTLCYTIGGHKYFK